MKKTMMFLGMLSLGLAHAQQGRVGINTDEPKATLEVKSTSPDEAKGVLIPQLTGDEMKTMTNTLTADQHGLITFATNGVTALDNAPTNNVQFAGYHRFNVDGSNKSWVRLEPSGLEKIKGEGTNTGWALVGRDVTKYGKIGDKAVDLTTISRYTPQYKEYNNKRYLIGATGENSFTAGSGAIASNFSSVSIGETTMALGHVAVAFGWGAKAIGNRSFAVGNLSEAKGFSSIAIGYNVVAEDQEVAMGNYNTKPTSTRVWDDARLFVLGNGKGSPNGEDDVNWTKEKYRSDAFTVLRNGKVGIDIDNFEIVAQPSNAKLQVNGGVKVGNPKETLTCNEHNVGTMSYKEVNGSGVFGFCTKKESGEYVWAYLKGAHLHGESTNRGAFGSGL